MNELQGKVILIVGGATGIGAAAAIECADRGANVLVADLDEAAGKHTVALANAASQVVDVTSEASVQEMARWVEDQYGRLDVLIQTAGILLGAYTPVEELTAETFEKVWRVNVTGTFLCLKYLARLLKRSPKGVVLLFSSPAANFPSSSYAYGASKGGVQAFGIAAAHKLGEEGIRVNLVSPGGIDTAMKRSVIAVDAQKRQVDINKAIADSRLGDPQGVAKVLAWLASDDADYVRGVVSTR